MKGIRLPALGLAVAAALATGGAWAQSESTARGRAVFDKKGCQYCHSYVSRRAAPSVRDMLREFEGDPQRVLKGIGVAAQHREALAGGKVTDADQRLIAEWLGADFLPDAEEADEPPARAEAAPRTAAPVAAAPVDVAPSAAPAVAAVAASPQPVTPPSAPITGPAVSAVRLQSLGAAGGERLVVELRGGEPDSVDMRLVDNRLVMTFVGAGLAGVPGLIQADSSFKVVQSVEARSAGETVTITVMPRDAGWTYSGMQGRNRMVVDFAAQPKAVPVAKAPPAKAVAGGVATAAATSTSTGLAAASAAAVGGAGAAVKTLPAGKTAAAKPGEKAIDKGGEKPAEKPADKAADKKVPAGATAGEKLAAAQKPADAKVAEQKEKAAEQTKVQELAKKAEQAKARELAEATARAKAAEEASARKREPERAVEAAKAPAVLAKAEPKADEVFGDGDTDSKPRRKVSKRPYKEPNLAPCPPPNPADQVIGVVDVERAKDIMDRIGCAQCHAYVQKKTGPPFREVLKKYKGDPACVIHRLKTNETHKDEGVTADIRGDEFKIIADYVATRMK